MILTIILLIILIFIYITELESFDKFKLCDKTPSGPYETKCTNIKLKDNVLSALCISDMSEKRYVSSQINLEECINDNNDCNSINTDDTGNLICEK
jgi:hypothetical protein